MYMSIYKDEAHNTGNKCLQRYPIVFSVNTNISSNKILGKTSLQHRNSSMAFILLSHGITLSIISVKQDCFSVHEQCKQTDKTYTFFKRKNVKKKKRNVLAMCVNIIAMTDGPLDLTNIIIACLYFQLKNILILFLC